MWERMDSAKRKSAVAKLKSAGLTRANIAARLGTSESVIVKFVAYHRLGDQSRNGHKNSVTKSVAPGWFKDPDTEEHRVFMIKQDEAFQKRMRQLLAIPEVRQPKADKLPLPPKPELLAKVVSKIAERAQVPPQKTPRDIINVTGKRIKSMQQEKPQDTERNNVRSIIRSVEHRFGFVPGTLVGADRSFAVAKARHEAIWVAKKLNPRISLTQLARIFHRDHTTILHSLRRYEQLMRERAEGTLVEYGVAAE